MSSLSLIPKEGSSPSHHGVAGDPSKTNQNHEMKFFEPQLRTYSAIRIAVVIISAGLIIAMIQLATKPLQRFLDCSTDTSSCQSSKRIQTIMSITVSFIIAIVAVVAVGFVLNILGLKLGSILAGAGILGLIIGLGAQSVIKDVVTGILIISENQISEGDYVYITTAKGEEIQGIIKSLSVRLIKLKNDQGSEVFIPSGNILHIANASRANQTVTVTITTPLGTDVRSITDVLQSLVSQLARDPAIHDKLLVQPQVGGVESLSDSTYTTQIQTQVSAGQQWTVGNYIRLQVVQALQNLEIHSPQVFVNIEKLPLFPGLVASETDARTTNMKHPPPFPSPASPPLAPPLLSHTSLKHPIQKPNHPIPNPHSSKPQQPPNPREQQRRAYGIQQIHQVHDI